MKFLIIPILLFSLICCKENSSTDKKEITAKDSIASSEIISLELKNTSENFKILQGRWENLQVPDFTLTFKGEEVTIDAQKQIKVVPYKVGDTCLNNSNPEGTNEKDMFISLLGEVQECYYILTLDDSTLEMGFLGAGNTLQFKRL